MILPALVDFPSAANTKGWAKQNEPTVLSRTSCRWPGHKLLRHHLHISRKLIGSSETVTPTGQHFDMEHRNPTQELNLLYNNVHPCLLLFPAVVMFSEFCLHKPSLLDDDIVLLLQKQKCSSQCLPSQKACLGYPPSPRKSPALSVVLSCRTWLLHGFAKQKHCGAAALLFSCVVERLKRLGWQNLLSRNAMAFS